jgi:hypothetical protein
MFLPKGRPRKDDIPPRSYGCSNLVDQPLKEDLPLVVRDRHARNNLGPIFGWVESICVEHAPSR